MKNGEIDVFRGIYNHSDTGGPFSLYILDNVNDDDDQKEHDRDLEITRQAEEAKQKKLETRMAAGADKILAEQGLQSETEAESSLHNTRVYRNSYTVN